MTKTLSLASPEFFSSLNKGENNFLTPQGQLGIPLAFCKELLIATGHSSMMHGLYPNVGGKSVFSRTWQNVLYSFMSEKLCCSLALQHIKRLQQREKNVLYMIPCVVRTQQTSYSSCHFYSDAS